MATNKSKFLEHYFRMFDLSEIDGTKSLVKSEPNEMKRHLLLANIPLNYKWDKFFIKRDLEREKEVFSNVLHLKDGEDFIFIHESRERPVIKEIPKDLKQIRPDNKDISLYDFLYTIEKAKEVHVMNSSFMNLIDCMKLRNEGLFYHEYSRPNINAVLKMNWKIIK